MKRKITVLTPVHYAACALRFRGKAQQPGRIPRIGFLPSIGDANNPGDSSQVIPARVARSRLYRGEKHPD